MIRKVEAYDVKTNIKEKEGKKIIVVKHFERRMELYGRKFDFDLRTKMVSMKMSTLNSVMSAAVEFGADIIGNDEV